MDTRWLRNSFVYLVIMVAVLAIFFTLFSPPARETQIGISELLAIVVRDARSNRVDNIVIQGNRVVADTSEGKKTAVKQDRTDLLDLLNQYGVRLEQVRVEVREPSQFTSWLGIIGSFVGGFVSWAMGFRPEEGAFRGAGWIMSIIGALIVVWTSLFLAARSGTGTRPTV